jgi:glycosyltransferase involved in cell wall biosynthesis
VAKVAFFLPDLRTGGAERVIVTLCRELTDRGVAVDVVLGRPQGALLKEVPDTARVIALPRLFGIPGEIGFAIDALVGLVRYLNSERPDCLSSSLTGANLVAVLARQLSRHRTRLVLREANTAMNFRNRFRRWAARMLYRAADQIVAVSKGVAADVAAELGIEPQKIRVIYNPVDIERIRDLAKSTPPHPWFQPGSVPVILGVGRLVPQKDFTTLLRAFSLVRDRIDARLVILGEGPERKALEDAAAKLGLCDHIALPGEVSNPFAYLRRASLFVLSSRWEGMPNVLLQALAVGTPVVATDCHSGPREILDGGHLGPLVPVGDDRALAEAVLATLSLDPEDLRERVVRLRERARDFSAATIATQYLSALLPAALPPAGV